MLAGRLAREGGFDEALLVTPHGRVLEGPTWSFFWVAGGELLTPPLEDRILPSITRALVIEEATARARRSAREERSSTLARARRSSRSYHGARCCAIAAIDEPRCCADVSRPGDERRRRARCARGSRAIWLEGPHRHREPAAVREGRGGLRSPARGRGRDPGAYGAALRRPSCRTSSSATWGCQRPDVNLSALAPPAHERADRAHAGGPGGRPAGANRPEAGHRLRRYELDVGRGIRRRRS